MPWCLSPRYVPRRGRRGRSARMKFAWLGSTVQPSCVSSRRAASSLGRTCSQLSAGVLLVVDRGRRPPPPRWRRSCSCPSPSSSRRSPAAAPPRYPNRSPASEYALLSVREITHVGWSCTSDRQLSSAKSTYASSISSSPSKRLGQFRRPWRRDQRARRGVGVGEVDRVGLGREQRLDRQRPVLLPRHGSELRILQLGQHGVERIGRVGDGQRAAGPRTNVRVAMVRMSSLPLPAMIMSGVTPEHFRGRGAEGVGGGVRVSPQHLRLDLADRLQHLVAGRERVLVGVELHHALAEPTAARRACSRPSGARLDGRNVGAMRRIINKITKRK